MMATKRSIAKKHRAVESALATLGYALDKERVRFTVVTDELEKDDWFAWIGDPEDTLGGGGNTQQKALDGLDRMLTGRMKRASRMLLAALDRSKAK